VREESGHFGAVGTVQIGKNCEDETHSCKSTGGNGSPRQSPPCLDDFADMKKATERGKQADCSNIGSRVAASKKKNNLSLVVLGYFEVQGQSHFSGWKTTARMYHKDER
jgi:hypothetical protein